MLQCELEECEDRSDDLLDRIEEEKERRGDLTKKVAETTALAQELKKERRMVNKEYQEAQEKLKGKKLQQLRDRNGRDTKGAWWPPAWFEE